MPGMDEKKITIVADAAIPFADEAFSRLGNVACVPGREIDAAVVADADALIVRTVTKVDEAMLAGGKVQFVGTATIGFDHVDRDYLTRAGIGFATAAGCNAVSVAEYVTTALLQLAVWRNWSLAEKTLGVVGVGNCGSRVVKRAEVLGMTVLQNDPPLERETGETRFRPIDELFERADILTYHVPLNRGGADNTFHMINAEAISLMRDGAVVINACRGAVHETAALKEALSRERLGGAVVDVWEDEPGIDLELLDLAAIATPHIAGYSRDGKVGGTTMMFEALRRHFVSAVTWDAGSVIQPPPVPHVVAEAAGRRDEDVRAEITAAVYDIMADDAALRRMADERADVRGAYFDRLRAEYAIRREFRFTTVDCRNASTAVGEKLRGLGFPA